MKIKLFAIGLFALLMVSIAGPSFTGRASAAVRTVPVASAPAAHNQAFCDRTCFLFDMGIAFFAIHHVYKKYQQGYYASGTSGRTKHIIAAGVVLLIAVNRLNAAYKRANESNSKTLHALVSPINALLGKAKGTYGTFNGKNGNVDPSTVDSSLQGLNSQSSQLGSQANGAGYNIKDISTPLPAGA